MELVKEDTQPTQTEGTDIKQEPVDEPKAPPPATTATEHPSHSPNPQTTSTYSSASSSVSPTLPPPALFVNALNLQPHTGNTNTTKKPSGFLFNELSCVKNNSKQNRVLETLVGYFVFGFLLIVFQQKMLLYMCVWLSSVCSCIHIQCRWW